MIYYKYQAFTIPTQSLWRKDMLLKIIVIIELFQYVNKFPESTI